MASAGTVTVDFVAETAKFTAELQKVNKRLTGIEGSFKTLGRVAKGALGAFSAGALTAFVKSAAAAADELGKTADKFGLSTQALRSFQLAATEAGVDVATANKLLTEGQKRLGEAAAGTGEASKFIKLLGLNVKDLQKLSPDELFKTYADAIGTLGNKSEQFAAAAALMGRQSTQAFALIQAGSPAINDASAFVERFGLALDRVDIKQIEAANDILGRLGAVSQGAGQRIAAGLAPAIQFFSKEILDATGNTKGLQENVEVFSAAAIVAFELVGNAARSLQAAFFGIAAGGARVLQFLTFGDVSKSFAASVDANLAKANEALGKIKNIEEIQQTVIKALEDSRQAAQAAADADAAREAARRAGGVTFGDSEAIGLTESQQFDLQNDALAAAAERSKEIQRGVTANLREQFRERAEASEAYTALRIRAEEAIVNAQNRALNAGLNALQQFAGKSKTVAIALVAINKARAIAQAIQNTSVGATLQLTTGDPYTAIARAAAVKAFGALEIAAILASGFGEVQQINRSGGAPIGSPSNPINTQVTANDQQFGATSQNAVQVIIAGNVGLDQRMIDQLIDGIREAADDRDVIIFGPESRQAKELVVVNG